MNGHVIVPNLIAVDFWKENAVPYYFLTHCHGDHVSPRLRRWTKKIYTSKLNCQILQLMFGVPKGLLVELLVGQTCAVGEFQVTPLDARHCPGSIAFLFQGEFGTILYTGDLRYWPGLLEEPALRYVLRSGGGLDRLYLDNTYCSPECVFPHREDVLDQVIRYLRECDDCDIYIGMRELGKEDAMLAIAEALQTRVHVSKSRLQLLELCAPSPLWTTDEAAGRIRLVPFRRIAEFGGQTDGGRPRVALLLTALFAGSQPPAPYSGGRVQVFPYSDHSSFPELCELVRRVRPRQVLPLVKRWGSRGWPTHRDLSARASVSVFRTYLRVDSRPRHPALAADSPPSRLELQTGSAKEAETEEKRQPESRSEQRTEKESGTKRQSDSLSGEDTDFEPEHEAVQRPEEQGPRRASGRKTGDGGGAGTGHEQGTADRAVTRQVSGRGQESRERGPGSRQRGPGSRQRTDSDLEREAGEVEQEAREKQADEPRCALQRMLRQSERLSDQLNGVSGGDTSAELIGRSGGDPSVQLKDGPGGGPSREAVSPPAVAGDAAAEPEQGPAAAVAEEELPCPFLVVAGRLEKLERVFYTKEEVDHWLASCRSPVICGEISSSCD